MKERSVSMQCLSRISWISSSGINTRRTAGLPLASCDLTAGKALAPSPQPHSSFGPRIPLPCQVDSHNFFKLADLITGAHLRLQTQASQLVVADMCQLTEIRHRCGCHYYPLFELLDPCAAKCGQELAPSLTRMSDVPCGLHSVPPYDPQSVEAFVRAEPKLPRFLFRGFHGINVATKRGLNTQTGVYPFAYFPRRSTASWSDGSGDGKDAEIGIPNEERPEDIRLTPLTFAHHMQLANYHVNFNLQAPVPTPYTSWTADFTTALWCAHLLFARAHSLGCPLSFYSLIPAC